MATGTQLMKEISDQFLVCKICLEPFKDPKTLSCLHTFCCACVQQQYDAESSARSSRYSSLYARAVSCPVCRKRTDLPTGGVRRLPDNFLVSNLTDVLAKRRCISKVPPCEICQTVRSRSCDACSRCLDCDKLLCRTCVELHSATKVTQDHSLIDLEGQKDIECKTHPEETVRFYCERCEECICVVCTFQEHKDHDVCSFNDGFSKHKSLLEGLLGRSKERMEDVSRRLKVIDKVETLSKELKERIRDLAISYTSQVRAREKELIRKVDEMLLSGSGGEGDGDRDVGEGIRQLTEQKTWLQERLDSLQSAANLTEIVVRDKGVEMLLLKKEIQGKMDHLLSGPLPPEPRDLAQLDLTFVPGEVKLGDIFVPGKKDEEGDQKQQIVKDISEKKKDTGGVNDVSAGKSLPSSDSCKLPPDCSGTNENVVMTTSQPCRACLKRKRQEEREEKRRNENNQTKRERRQSTKSAGTQTIVQETASQDNHSPTSTVSQVRASSTTVGAGTLHSMQQNHTSVPSSSSSSSSSSWSCSVGSDESRRPPPSSPVPPPSPRRRARGTMTARQDVRTLKVQTEDSCLRDTHLGHAAAAGSSYPNTGGAIAAAFLKHKPINQLEEQGVVLARSWPAEKRGDADPFPARETRDAQVTTDISLALTARSTADTLAALRQGEGGVGVGAVHGADLGKPDLLAETGMVALPPTSSSSSSSFSSPWIRSRKVQTEISALDSKPIGEGQCIIDGEMKRALFVSSGSGSQSQSAATVNRDTVPSLVTSSSSALFMSAPSRARARPSSCDVGVMTSFKVKLVPDSVDRDTLTEAVTSHGVGVMTSPDTRTVYIQTLLKKLRSTAAGTDYEGQMSKSVSTQPVSSMDAETTMPQVRQETRTTWTDAVVTSERATSATGPETSDAVTLTTQVQTSSFSAQMRPESWEASTNTAPTPSAVHHHTQAAPTMVSRSTVPDTSHLPPPPQSSGVPATSLPHIVKDASSGLLGSGTLSFSPSGGASSGLSKAGEASLLSPGALSSVLAEVSTAAGGGVEAVSREDKGTATVSPHCVAVAAGPSSQMFSCRTTSTDTANLLQVSEKETCTLAVKTVDEWTHTPQPQVINTGVTPHRPAHMEVGVATNPVVLMDQATYTEVKTYRDTATESGLVVCDSETLTERTLHYDAQTGADVMTESQSTSMEAAERADGCCMTEQQAGQSPPPPPPPPPLKETHDSESQCLSPRLVNKDVNTTRYRRKVKEVQTCYSYVECLLCQHPDKLEQLTVTKTFTDTSTDPSPPDTHDVATMALSCLASPSGLVNTGIQTSAAALYDKGVATSFDFDEELETKHPLGLECQDAATSTESLPYIGLLSEIDVDELIVIPEANFELVSDSDEDSVSMVDDETLTEVLDYVEVGTQTILPMSGTVASPEQIPVSVHKQDDCSKHLVSVGVNTMPKVTFEKETCTPIRHLFSKGTMTFFVAKMDKATSTISQIRSLEHRQGAASGGGGVGGRVVKEASRQRAMDNKDTMTNRTEHRDMAVETDSTLMDGRITQCISKLRSVSERLNSPTLRKTGDGDMFFGQSFYSQRSTSSLASPTSPPQYLSSPTMPPRDSNVFLLSPPRDVCAEEAQRQTQLHNLLVETDAVLKSKESPGVRKAQPITTLKTRSPEAQGDIGNYASKSFPRPRSLERQNRVKMGSQATSPSRLPLSRYNSAPGRIATVPAQTLLLKTGQTSPRASPSKIPVCQKPTTITISSPTSEVGSDSETHSTSPTQKVQQRPSLPSISETRTPSSCSETSCLSMEFEDSSLKPVSSMATSHSRTPSNVTSVSDTASDAVHTKDSAETLSTDCRESNEDDSSSACSASTTLVATPTPGTNPSPGSSGKQKKDKKEKEKKEKEKKGFMQRFLPGKKKKDTGSSDQEKEGASKTDSPQEPKQQPTVPPSPKVQKKQAAEAKTNKGAKPKKPKKSDVVASALSAEAASPPVSTSSASRPSSTGSALSAVMKGALAPVVVPEGSDVDGPPPPAMPPHHYPPLPDPNKTPPPPRKPRPFVYVRQRIMSIQQDNVEEVKERKEKEKEEKEKKEKEKEAEEKEKDKQEEEVEKDEEKTRGEEKEKGKKFKGVVIKVAVSEQVKVKDSDKRKSKEEKMNKKKTTRFLVSAGRTAAAKSEAGAKGKDGKEAVVQTAESGKGGVENARKAAEKGTGSKSGKSEGKEKKVEGKTRVGWIRGK